MFSREKNIPLILRTIRHLKVVQVYYQVKRRLRRPDYISIDAPAVKRQSCCLKTEPVPRHISFHSDGFTFLNLKHPFSGWDFTGNGMLWAYNQNYFDWLNQPAMTKSEGVYWIDRFIDETLTNPVRPIGLEPYPIALRTINWIKFFCKYPECGTKDRLDSLYSQLKLLESELEYHLLANHLLEDLFALYVGAVYFSDVKLYRKSRKKLLKQLDEQILSDGAHFEQSPMYHCIMLDRLLDCINIGESLYAPEPLLREYAVRMLGHLDSICYSDGSMPLMNDAAQGIAPQPKQIFDYACRLGLRWTSIALGESGYRKLVYGNMEAIVDVGNITATYQPGHTHADVLNYELYIGGTPYIVDTGISTYEKNTHRQYERSTVAHNCVAPDDRNSCEVWDGFRVGRRCRTKIVQDTSSIVVAWHDGFGKPCKRRFEITKDRFTVEDWFEGDAVSYVHIAEGADAERLKVEGAKEIEVKECKYSIEYNSFRIGTVLKIHFSGYLKYTIR